MRKKGRKRESQARRKKENWERVVKDPKVERAYWIMGDPITPAQQKGQYAEKMACQALKGLQQRKVKFPKVGVIVNVTLTSHLGPKDKRAIDIEIEFWSEIIFAEVKAHRWTKEEARRWLDQNRCFIGIPWGISEEGVEWLAWQALTWFLREREEKRIHMAQRLGAYR